MRYAIKALIIISLIIGLIACDSKTVSVNIEERNIVKASDNITVGTKEFADKMIYDANNTTLTTRANIYSQIAIATYLKLIYEKMK